MSPGAAAPPARQAAGNVSDRALPDWSSTALIAVAFLLFTVQLTPFADLQSVSNIEVSSGGNILTQVAFLSLLGAALWALSHIGFVHLKRLATRAWIGLACWIGVSMLFSPAPFTSVRKFALTAICIVLAATLLLVARSVRHLALTLALVALGILAVSYVSIALLPEYATHTRLDLREPELAGDWRGVFVHKNEAGAATVLFVFIGLLAWSVGFRILGAVVAIAAGVFLYFSHSKTALTLLPVVLAAVWTARFVRMPLLRNAILLSPLALIGGVALGAFFLQPVRGFLDRAGLDVTFTGRTEIWKFALDHISQRPITGWGYGAFWRTEGTALAYSSPDNWFAQADQAHSAYFDAALFMGVPGLLLTLVAFVFVPLRDLGRVDHGRIDATTSFFLSVWLYTLGTGFFESVLFSGGSAMFLLFMLAVFGLRYRTQAAVIVSSAEHQARR